MHVVHLSGLDDPRFVDRDVYRHIGDHERLRSCGWFVAEGRLVVERLIEAALEDRTRFSVRSLLLNDSALRALEPHAAGLGAGVTAFVCRTGDFETLTGYDIHRGCLALASRPPLRSIDDVSARAQSLVLLEDVANADNVGGIFRNAAAFGVGGVMLSRKCADPLYRKAIRTSMAAVLRVPFAMASDDDEWRAGLRALRRRGFQLVGLTPQASAMDLEAFADGARGDRVALLVGAEGAGLTAESESAVDVCVRIPICAEVDSLNVAVAAGIAFHRLLRSNR